MGVHESNRGLCEALEDFYECCLLEIGQKDGGVYRPSGIAWGHRLSEKEPLDNIQEQQAFQRGVSRRTQRVLEYEPGCARIWQMLMDRACLEPDG
jgi:hypothetical protein